MEDIGSQLAACAVQPPPEVGQLVNVRNRRFVVTGLETAGLPLAGNGGAHLAADSLVHLSCVEDDGMGEELTVLWQLEPGAQSHDVAALPAPDGFDDPSRFDAFLNSVRWGAISQADTKALQAPFRSGVEVEDYQLDPLVRALNMPRVNLLIADDVGLGKTIESGLVAQELVLRYRVRTILIICPASIQIQWQTQMRDKFGLEFRIVDSDLFKELRRRRGLHVNPWSHFPRLITSMDFIKRDRPFRLFRETLPAEGEPAFPRRYDLLILDEAHNIAPSGRGKYATDSLRTQTIRALVPHFEHKLFLSATPHNGYPESFSALLELLDNQRFARGVTPNRAQLETILVRRLKSELKFKSTGARRFADREIAPLEVAYTPAEHAVHAALCEYTKLRLENAASDAERLASEFVLKLLKKRLFSSPQAFALTFAKHEASLPKTTGPAADISARALQKEIEETEEEYANDAQYEEAADQAVQTASRLFHAPTASERSLLRELREYAATAPARPDSKAAVLIEWLRQHIRPQPPALRR